MVLYTIYTIIIAQPLCLLLPYMCYDKPLVNTFYTISSANLLSEIMASLLLTPGTI